MGPGVLFVSNPFGAVSPNKVDKTKQTNNKTLLFITTIKFALRTVAMATAVSQHACYLGRHLGFFKKKIGQNCSQFRVVSRKNVFTVLILPQIGI